MKRIGILPEQKSFFEKNGFIEFEELLSSEEIDTLKKYLEGKRDKLHPMIASRRLAELASDLSTQKPLRLGTFFNLLKTASAEITLEKIASCQRVHIGLVLSFEDFQNTTTEWLPLPTTKGSGFFFKPDKAWNPASLPEDVAKNFLLLTYTGLKGRYVYQSADLYMHENKAHGYSAGDELRDLWNPVLVR